MALEKKLKELDKYLFKEGTHSRLYENLGAHLSIDKNYEGVNFAVWAPNAKKVSVIGTFNDWKRKKNNLNFDEESGIWSGFINGIDEWTLYKYTIETKHHGTFEKSDPFSFAFEVRPKTGSLVYDINNFVWNDTKWMEKRKETTLLDKPLSVYEVHLGSWLREQDEKYGLRYLSYEELSEYLIDYVSNMEYTHIELMPILEFPFDGSWGYQSLGYFAPTSRFGTPEEFQNLVDKAHQNNIGVILDWVPAHFPKDASGLDFFDGTHLYEYEDSRKGDHPQWGTKVFDYGKNEVRSFLMSSAAFWLDKYHIDGLRVDAVSSMLYLDYGRNAGEWVPNIHGGNQNLEAVEFIKNFNKIMHKEFPGILTIAEESTAWPGVSRPTYSGGLGFSLKWNMGWMHDTLKYMQRDPVYRKHHVNELTFSILYARTENFLLPFSHDEVVHGKGSMINKMPGDEWQKFANLRLLYGYMFAHPGKKLLFMGDDIAQRKEWNHDEGLDWGLLNNELNRGINSLVKDLNKIYKKNPALYERDFSYEGFEWRVIDDFDNSVLAFERKSNTTEDSIYVISNFTPVPRPNYRICVSHEGNYKQILNTDSSVYGGTGIYSKEEITLEKIGTHNKSNSILLDLPPLSTIYLKMEK